MRSNFDCVANCPCHVQRRLHRVSSAELLLQGTEAICKLHAYIITVVLDDLFSLGRLLELEGCELVQEIAHPASMPSLHSTAFDLKLKITCWLCNECSHESGHGSHVAPCGTRHGMRMQQQNGHVNRRVHSLRIAMIKLALLLEAYK